MQQQPGFCRTPKPLRLYVRAQGTSRWYSLDANNAQIPVEEEALCGQILKMELIPKDEEELKLDTTILAHRPVIVRSGANTLFSKNLGLAILQLSPEQLRGNLILAVEPVHLSQTNRTVAGCTVYDAATNQQIWCDAEQRNQIEDWMEVIVKAIARVDEAHGRAMTPPPALPTSTTTEDKVSVVRAQIKAQLNKSGLKFSNSQMAAKFIQDVASQALARPISGAGDIANESECIAVCVAIAKHARQLTT